MKLSFVFVLSIPAFVLATLLAASCTRFVRVDPPATQTPSARLFADPAAAQAAVSGLYALLGNTSLNFINGGVTLYTGLLCDELYPTAPNSDADPFYTDRVAPTHPNLYNRLWKAAYNNNCLYTANAILEGLGRSPALDSALKSQLTGEVKVIRALAYFYLVNLFGDVPLVTSTDYPTNALAPRTPVSTLYRFMTTELLEAEAMLSPVYLSEGRARINRFTATALLARVYLYQRNWAAAEAMATAVIGSGFYKLNASLTEVFTDPRSPETIWQLVRDNSPTAEGATFIPSLNQLPGYALPLALPGCMEAGDLRTGAWMGRQTVSGVDYYYPFKYKVRTGGGPAEYLVLFRLAEQYLIRAEARSELGNLAGAAADLNTVRHRSGLGGTKAGTQASLLEAIARERQAELFCEGGHRWLDLKRRGSVDSVMIRVKPATWQSNHALLPLPQSELDQNPFLQQNPGY